MHTVVRGPVLSELCMEILSAEVSFCFTLVELASLDINSQDWESADWIVRTASRQYNSLVRMLRSFHASEVVQAREDVQQIGPLLKRLRSQLKTHSRTV